MSDTSSEPAPVNRPITAAVFASGALLLGVEIAASRVMAPYFGSSLYVWGSLIGVVLAGLAAGYAIGGRVADRSPKPSLLVAVLIVGATLVALIPVLDEPILRVILAWDPGPRASPFLAAVALFGPMSVVLAAVTPIAVRLRTQQLANLGRTAGNLFSVSTAGSIAGCFLTAFWLVPTFGTQQLLAYSAAALLGVTTLVAISQKLLRWSYVGLALTLGVSVLGIDLAPATGGKLSSFAAKNWSPIYRLRNQKSRDSFVPDNLRIRYQKDTQYHHLLVAEDQLGVRYMRFDNLFQSAWDPKDPYRTIFAYTDLFHLGRAYNPGAKRMLLIGLGGGSAAKRLWHDFPDATIHTVELDPEVVKVARQWFGFPNNKRLPVTAEDGRHYLQRVTEKYDVILVDAFFSDGIPFHLATKEFFELVRKRLNPGGVVVMNSIGSLSGPGSKLFRSVMRTQRTVFPSVTVHPLIESADETDASERNLEIVAMLKPLPSKEQLRAEWVAERPASAPTLTKAISDRYDKVIPSDDVPTLSDDFAPTDAILLN